MNYLANNRFMIIFDNYTESLLIDEFKKFIEGILSFCSPSYLSRVVVTSQNPIGDCLKLKERNFNVEKLSNLDSLDLLIHK